MRQYIMADFNIVTLLVLLQWNLRLGGRAHCGILHRLQCCRLRWIQVRILGVAPHGRFPMVCPCIHIEELCSTLLGELFIALFLLLCATLPHTSLFVVSHRFLCFFLQSVTFSIMHEVLRSVLHSFWISSAQACSVTVVYWRDIASCNSGRQTCLNSEPHNSQDIRRT